MHRHPNGSKGDSNMGFLIVSPAFYRGPPGAVIIPPEYQPHDERDIGESDPVPDPNRASAECGHQGLERRVCLPSSCKWIIMTCLYIGIFRDL